MNLIWIKNGDFPTLDEDLCCAIGNFDGVHKGHQQLISKSKEYKYKSAVLTFYPHPYTYIKHINPYRQLTPIDHKIKIIESLGVDYLIIVEFNEKIMNMEKELFMANLKKLGIKAVVCGYDFTFAKNATGTIKDLDENFIFHEIPKYQINNVRVSTTYTKELLMIGDVNTVKEMLGRPYSIIGKVITGKHLGSKIGFPTANISYGIYVLPLNGVYATRIKCGNNTYYGMTNVGNNPTVDFSSNVKIEVNIFDFDSDIYGEEVEIIFDERIRDENKFSSIKELKKQLDNDKIEVEKYYEKGEL